MVVEGILLAAIYRAEGRYTFHGVIDFDLTFLERGVRITER
jgi:hypothetical protein